MSRILMLGLAAVTGTALLTGGGEAAAQAHAVDSVDSSVCAVIVIPGAPLKAAPDDTAPQVGTAAGATWVWVDLPPVNRYYRMEPGIDRPPMPGTGSWVREDYIATRSCPA